MPPGRVTKPCQALMVPHGGVRLLRPTCILHAVGRHDLMPPCKAVKSPLLLKEGAERSEAGDLTLIAVRRTIKPASKTVLYRSFVNAQMTEGRLKPPAAR